MKRGGEKNGTLEPEASAQQKNKMEEKGRPNNPSDHQI